MLTSRKKGFTIVEILVVLTLISVIAAVTSGIVISSLQMLLHVPAEVDARKAAQDIINEMIDGRAGVWGVRYASAITTASTNDITYTVGNPAVYNVSFSLNGGRILRRVNGSPSAGEIIPYYGTNRITVAPIAPSTQIFTYRNSSGVNPSSLAEIRRVNIDMVVTMAGRSFKVATAAEIRQ